MRVVLILFGVALFVTCCDTFELGADANTKLDLQVRSRRSLDVGWLLRNLLLNSATASDLKANVTRTFAASQRPPPPTRRPSTTRPPTTPAPPPPPPPFNPFLNKFALFASSSDFWNPMRSTTTTTTTMTPEEPEASPPPPPPPPPRRPRPRPKPFPRPPPGWNRPPYGSDYDYFYPSRFEPPDYDYDDVPTAQSAPPPSPSPPPSPPPPPRNGGRNRQRPAAPPPPPAPTQPAPPPPPPTRRRPPASPPPPPPPAARPRPPPPPPAPAPPQSAPQPQPQRDRLLYQYMQRDDTSSNESNDDVAGPPETVPEADIPPEEEDDNSNAVPGGADATNGDVGDENEIPGSDEAGPPPEVLSPRLPSFARRPNARPAPSPPFASPSYYDAIHSSPYHFGSFSADSGFDSSSFGFNHASPAKGSFQFQDAFSDFQTTYDGGHFQPSAFSLYK